MSDIQELVEAIRAAGATIHRSGSDLVIQPASRVPPELKARLREHKPELLNYLSRQFDIRDSWEWIEERAAIFEFDGGLNRNEATHRVFMLWYRQFTKG